MTHQDGQQPESESNNNSADKFKVIFYHVGHNQRHWETFFDERPTNQQLIADVVGKSGLLETRNIACEKDRIYAGDVDVGSYIVKAI